MVDEESGDRENEADGEGESDHTTLRKETREIRVPMPAVAAEVRVGPDRGRTALSDGQSLSVGTAESNALVLTDPTVSRFHAVIFRTSTGGIGVRDKASTNGTFCGDVRVECGEVTSGSVLTVGNTQLRVSDAPDVEVDLYGAESLQDLRGRSPAMRRVFAMVARAAQTELSVLVLGESGTGKERIARAIHDLGPRASGPFVTVDCASLSPTLVASELFGHERGAFTGAERRHEGAFEQARGGTLFLDELGELPESLQPLLLGALERRRIRRLGGREDVPVDVRVVSATNRDLQAEVNQGRFRLDLYYRVAVLQIAVPPLRERPEDVEVLIELFLREMGEDGPLDRHFGAATIASLQRHAWPGNARELRNLVAATVAMGETPPLDVTPPVPRPPLLGGESALGPLLALPYKDARGALLRQFEETYLRAALDRANGNVAEAARSVGVDRTHLFALLKRHRLR